MPDQPPQVDGPPSTGRLDPRRKPGRGLRPHLRRRDYADIACGAVLLSALLATCLVLVTGQQQHGRDELTDRFSTRAELAASFVAEYVVDLSSREATHAARALAESGDAQVAFEKVVESFAFDAALLLDGEGRALQAWPRRPDLIGTTLIGEYPHLEAAVGGGIGVSNVVPSAAGGEPITAVAVPFEARGGTYIFSGGFIPHATPLGNYFDTAVPTSGGRAYLVDATNQIIVNGESAIGTLDTAPLTVAQLAGLDGRSGPFRADGTSFVYARHAVAGTPWDVVLTASAEALYAPVDRATWKSWLLLGALVVAAIAGLALLARVARARAAVAAIAYARGTEAAMLRSVISNDRSLIYVKDLDGRYVLANHAFEEAFAVTEGDLIGKTNIYLDAAQAPAWQAEDERAKEGLRTIEEWTETPNGRRWYESRKFPLADADGVVYATCGVSLDVTERRLNILATEAARDAAQLAAARQMDFAASASHELRTPTTSIIGYVEEVLDNDALAQDDRQFLEVVYRNAQRLSKLIDDLLILGHSEIGASMMQLERTDLAPLVERVISTFSTAASGADITLTIDPDSVAPSAMVDPQRLEQVLTNLVSNALKFSPSGAAVVIDISSRDDTVRVAVTDTGMGIDEGDLDHIFGRFYRAQNVVTAAVKGSGLGLAIAKAMVEAQNGQLKVTSTPGCGSTFTISLPRATQALPTPSQQRPGLPSSARSPEPLLVNGDRGA